MFVPLPFSLSTSISADFILPSSQKPLHLPSQFSLFQGLTNTAMLLVDRTRIRQIKGEEGVSVVEEVLVRLLFCLLFRSSHPPLRRSCRILRYRSSDAATLGRCQQFLSRLVSRKATFLFLFPSSYLPCPLRPHFSYSQRRSLDVRHRRRRRRSLFEANRNAVEAGKQARPNR
jgi:hypothetical protein